MKLLGFAVAWAGYVLMWWGWSSIQGPGVGIMDLVIPGRVPKVSQYPSQNATASGPAGLPGIPGMANTAIPPNMHRNAAGWWVPN